MNERSSESQAKNDRTLYFTDQTSADEVAHLINLSSQSPKATPKILCPMWKPVIENAVSKTKHYS